MQQQIDHLESLVKKLIAQHQQDPLSKTTETKLSIKNAISDGSDSTRSPGKTVIDAEQSVYKGAEDWYDVLQEVCNLSFFSLL